MIVIARHRCELAELLASFARSIAPAAGTVPATGALFNDYHRSAGFIGADENAGPNHNSPPPEAAGIVPAKESLGDDCYKSMGSINSAGHRRFVCSSLT
jgi:hypothetical protein